MDTRMINFVIPSKLLEDVDRLAQRESRSRSELLREAARRYISESEQKKRDFARIRRSAKKINISEVEAIRMVDDIRSSLPINQ